MATDKIKTPDAGQVEQALREASTRHFSAFVGSLYIAGAHGPVLFESVMAPHQREFFSAVGPSLEALRDGEMPPHRRFWIERTKKAGKDSDLAICILWLLAFPTRPIELQVGAADRDQAAIVRSRIRDLLYFNPWVKKYVAIRQWKVSNNANLAQLEIIPADAASAHGATPDLLVVNELSHITRWEFVQNLLDNADGVPRGMVLIATNAGFHGSPAARLHDGIQNTDKWKRFYFRQPAPWIDPSDLADARRRNSPSRFQRLWHGRWVSGRGDALDEKDIGGCFRLDGPTADPDPGWIYLGGLDLGISHDHAAAVIVGINPDDQRVRLCNFERWAPPEGGEIDLMSVETTVGRLAQHYGVRWWGYDPYQAKLMAQRLTRRGIPMAEVPFVGRNLDAMARSLLGLVEDARLECYDDEGGTVRRDLGSFNIVERSYGYRLEAPTDGDGHADVGTAIMITLPTAVEMLGGNQVRSDDPVYIDTNVEPIADGELEEMPQDLREIYEMDDAIVQRGDKEDDW